MNESWPYKCDLLEFADNFHRRSMRQIWRENSIKKAEKMFFVGFYFVRKLIECRKVTDNCARSSTSIARTRLARAREVSDFMRHDLEKDLKLADFSEAKIDVGQLCDKVIHAWWCIPTQNDSGGLGGYILTTDKKRNIELWLVPLESIVDVFRRFGNDDITAIKARRDDNGRLTYWRAE